MASTPVIMANTPLASVKSVTVFEDSIEQDSDAVPPCACTSRTAESDCAKANPNKRFG